MKTSEIDTPLAKRLTKFNITRFELMRRTQICMSQICTYVNGGRPSATNGAKIASALNTKVEELWPGVTLRK